MDMNKLTQKSQEAVQGAQSKAVEFSHQQVDAEHLLLVLLEDTNGLVSRVLQKAGAAV
ncbi:MAG: Clp protease N-terminal domain-containing protein [Acidobacteriota bacterium]